MTFRYDDMFCAACGRQLTVNQIRAIRNGEQPKEGCYVCGAVEPDERSYGVVYVVAVAIVIWGLLALAFFGCDLGAP